VSEWTTIAAMVRDTQENGSNAVERDTEDDSSLTNRQHVGSNDTQVTNATPTVDGPGNNDTFHQPYVCLWYLVNQP
jgi:hypothetical protein